jgi:hypothetical protein
MGRETMMKVNAIPKGTDALLAFAHAIATVLAEKRDELGISTDVEALQRASIAAATFAIEACNSLPEFAELNNWLKNQAERRNMFPRDVPIVIFGTSAGKKSSPLGCVE